jgi:hypothetical protein
MKRLLVSAAVLGLLSSAPAFAQAGPSSTASTPADAEIVQSISVTSDESHLNFGKIAAPVETAGTVSVVDAAGTLQSSDPNLIVSGSIGSAAKFNVSGALNLAYTPSLGAAQITLTDGANSMLADLSIIGNSPTLNGSGLDSFEVIGDLHVAGGQAAGVYHGTVNVSVQYT